MNDRTLYRYLAFRDWLPPLPFLNAIPVPGLDARRFSLDMTVPVPGQAETYRFSVAK